MRRVTIKADNRPLGKVVAELQQQSGIPIEKDETTLPTDRHSGGYQALALKR